ncbi:hypothetical protein AAG747_04340 [Rapidithrix thailandica]|uniref:Lipocalin-like domain-containing protein n=1 Tax=Rapidithrix thailandica TaxID=413964 RepID=A0AAW9RQE6_9BACT
MIKRLNWIFLLSLAVLFSQCTDDDDPDTTKSKEEVLAGENSKKWKLSKMNVPASASGITIHLNVLTFGEGVCLSDNIFEFFADGKLLVDEGTQKCSENSPQQVSGTWKWDESDENILIIGSTVFDGIFEEYNLPEFDGKLTVETLTETKMVIPYTFKTDKPITIDYNGTTATLGETIHIEFEAIQ